MIWLNVDHSLELAPKAYQVAVALELIESIRIFRVSPQIGHVNLT
jgi:hypothetical protein